MTSRRPPLRIRQSLDLIPWSIAGAAAWGAVRLAGAVLDWLDALARGIAP